MSLKVIATDLDGTLLDGNGELSEENYNAITELAGAGVTVVPISGRAKGELPDAVLHHPSIRYIITSSGAVLEDLKTGEKVERLISAEEVEKIYGIIKGREVIVNTHHKGISYLKNGVLEDEYMGASWNEEYFLRL